MSSFRLKFLACAAMLADHIGAVFLPYGLDSGVYILLRTVGRIAFPIFVYLIAEGCRKTKSMPKYMLRLFTAGLVSEIAFDLAFHKVPLEFTYQNVMFTLLLGALAVYAVQKLRLLVKNPTAGLLLGLIPAALCAAAGELLRTDYGFQGVLCVFFIWLAGDKKTLQAAVTALCCVFLSLDIRFISVGFNGLEFFSVFSVLPIALYNGKRGPNNAFVKYSFYGFYPLHLFVLYATALAVSRIL